MINITLDNIVFSLQKAGGISVVWFEILKRIKNDSDFDVSFIEYPNQNIFREQLNIQSNKILNSHSHKLPIAILRYLSPDKAVPFGIFHSSYYRTISAPQIINVTTVHDFTYEYFRNGLPKIVHSWQKKKAIKKSARIICVSENTKKDLLKFYPETDEKKIRVIYNGVDESYQVLADGNKLKLKELIPYAKRKYALFVGDRKSNHKNFSLAVEACKSTNVPLVIVGGGILSKSENELLLNKLGNSNFSQLMGIPNEKLNILYNHALCLLYPSEYEGFGIPVIEAQKAGCPVIAANVSSIPEIIGETKSLLEDITVENIAAIIDQLRMDQDFLLNEIENGLKNSKRFSWDICYQQTKTVYEELFNEYFQK